MLSVIVPHYNQQDVLLASLPKLKAHLDALGVAYEILVVDDGSNQGQRPSSTGLDKAVKLIQLPRNRGKGYAVRTGMLAAQGDCRLFIDADLPFDLGIIDTCYLLISSKQAHIVAGRRDSHVLPSRGKRRFVRGVSSVIFNFLVSRFLIPELRDSQCGVKACSSQLVELAFPMLRIDRFAFDVELYAILHRNRLPVRRIPLTQVESLDSTVSLFRDSINMVFSLLVIFVRMNLGLYDNREIAVLPRETSPSMPLDTETAA